MKKLIETERKMIYSAFDNNKGKFLIAESESMIELISICKVYARSYYGFIFDTLFFPSEQFVLMKAKTHAPFHASAWWFWYYAKNIYILDSHGNLVQDYQKIEDEEYKPRANKGKSQHRQYRSDLSDLMLGNLLPKKGNPYKTKSAYTTYRRISSWSGEEYFNFANFRHYRRIKTLSSIRKTNSVEKDEGEPEFRGKRRRLPSTWDDITVSVHYNCYSWKHNSKRRKQWKPKASQLTGL